jgi:hypothetical protein
VLIEAGAQHREPGTKVPDYNAVVVVSGTEPARR